jgi:16S rRNA (guanine527-N7)-methyltransferase
MNANLVHLARGSVSRETFALLKEFEGLVQRWSPAINLVSKSSLADVWDRHIVESVQVFQLAPLASHWVDLGSGGGFPGLVVAILAREFAPEMRITLVESDLRKATFLRQAAQSLDLQAAIVTTRIAETEPLNAEVLSARALSPLPVLLEYAVRHLKPGGVAVFPKGSRHADEVAAARKAWTFDLEACPSVSEPEAAILMIRNIHRAQND